MVTILDLTKYRLGLAGVPVADEGMNGQQFQDVGLAIMGGCAVCGATLAAYNGCPSKAGYWKCAHGCIDGDGWESVAQANVDLFGPPDDDETLGLLRRAYELGYERGLERGR